MSSRLVFDDDAFPGEEIIASMEWDGFVKVRFVRPKIFIKLDLAELRQILAWANEEEGA